MKVKQLKQELQKRGLDKKGVKEVLVQRLKKAIEEEGAKEAVMEETGKTNNAEVKTGDVGDDVLRSILSVVCNMNDRLEKLESKLDIHLSIISDQNAATITNLRAEKESLELLTREMSSQLATPRPSLPTVATVPTSNRFVGLNDECKEQVAVKEKSIAKQQVAVKEKSKAKEQVAVEEKSNAKEQVIPVKAKSMKEQLDEYRKERKRDVQRQKAEATGYDAIVIGDSMIKFIDGKRLSRTKRVDCRSTPGAKADQLHLNVCENLKHSGECIIHVGTNNLAESSRGLHDKIVALGATVEAKGNRPCISGIIHRRWENIQERKRVQAVNEALEATSLQRGWGYISNSNIEDRHLVADGVHLSRSGQGVLAGNFARFINRRAETSTDLHHQARRSYAEVTAGQSASDFTQGYGKRRMNLQKLEWEKYLQFVRAEMRK